VANLESLIEQMDSSDLLAPQIPDQLLHLQAVSSEIVENKTSLGEATTPLD